jgi:hypothetical protein
MRYIIIKFMYFFLDYRETSATAAFFKERCHSADFPVGLCYAVCILL